MRVVAVIPARHGSTRLPGKPLLDIHGKSLIERVHENARGARAPHHLWIATDDERIEACVHEFGGQVAMTPTELVSGTDRIAWLARTKIKADVYLNIQGDEPLLEPSIMDQVVELVASGRFPMASAVTPFQNKEEWASPSTVKCVLDLEGARALYFTRAKAPYTREAPPRDWKGAVAQRHLGIYAYSADALERISQLPPAPLELAESLEQLRALANGIPIGIAKVQTTSFGVDTPEDLERMRKEWPNRKNTSS